MGRLIRKWLQKFSENQWWKTKVVVSEIFESSTNKTWSWIASEEKEESFENYSVMNISVTWNLAAHVFWAGSIGLLRGLKLQAFIFYSSGYNIELYINSVLLDGAKFYCYSIELYIVWIFISIIF